MCGQTGAQETRFFLAEDISWKFNTETVTSDIDISYLHLRRTSREGKLKCATYTQNKSSRKLNVVAKSCALKEAVIVRIEI